MVSLSNGEIRHSRTYALGLSPRMYPVDTTATASCNRGYSLSGQRVRTCQSNGHWTGQAATCQQGEKSKENESIYTARNSLFQPL